MSSSFLQSKRNNIQLKNFIQSPETGSFMTTHFCPVGFIEHPIQHKNWYGEIIDSGHKWCEKEDYNQENQQELSEEIQHEILEEIQDEILEEIQISEEVQKVEVEKPKNYTPSFYNKFRNKNTFYNDFKFLHNNNDDNNDNNNDNNDNNDKNNNDNNNEN